MLIERNSNALPLFFTDTVYIVSEKQQPEISKKKAGSEETPAIKSQPAPTEPLTSIPYEGKNLKKILLLFQNEQGKNLAESAQTFLGKVLQAVNLNFDDVALVNFSQLEPSAYAPLNQFDASVWLSFGVSHQNLPIHLDFPLYKIIKNNDVSFLLTDPLEEIEENRDKKVLLWNNLKTLFH